MIGLLLWFVCVRMELEKDAAIGIGRTPDLIACQHEARERMSAEERAAWREEQSLALQSMRFFRHLGIALTMIGGAGFAWFQLSRRCSYRNPIDSQGNATTIASATARRRQVRPHPPQRVVRRDPADRAGAIEPTPNGGANSPMPIARMITSA